MSTPKTSTEMILVHLNRPGVGVEDHQLAKGQLGHFLSRSAASTKHSVVILDGVEATESMPLKSDRLYSSPRGLRTRDRRMRPTGPSLAAGQVRLHQLAAL